MLVPVRDKSRDLLLLPAVPPRLPRAHQQNRTGTAIRYVGSASSRGPDRRPVHLRAAHQRHLRAPHDAARAGARVLLAVAANRQLRGIKVFRTIFASTVATSVAVASVVFFVLVNPQVGYFSDVSFISL